MLCTYHATDRGGRPFGSSAGRSPQPQLRTTGPSGGDAEQSTRTDAAQRHVAAQTSVRKKLLPITLRTGT